MYLAIWYFWLLNMVDAALTATFVGKTGYFREGNPLVRWVIDNYGIGTMFWGKFVVGTLIALSCMRAMKEDSRYVKIFVTIIGTVYTLLLIYWLAGLYFFLPSR